MDEIQEKLEAIPFHQRVRVRLAVLADLAIKSAKSIRACLPVKGSDWTLGTSPHNLPLTVGGLHWSGWFEAILNPKRLPFDDPARQDPLSAEYFGCLFPNGTMEVLTQEEKYGISPLTLAAAMRLVGVHNHVIRHYNLTEVVCRGGPYMPRDWANIPPVESELLITLEQTATELNGFLSELKPKTSAILEALAPNGKIGLFRKEWGNTLSRCQPGNVSRN